MSRIHLENSGITLSSSAERLLYLLKTRGAQQAADAGHILGITSEAARQQFAKLALLGLVESYAEVKGVGRPSQFWQLTQAGHARFPNAYSELTLQLLDTVRETFGAQAIDSLIDIREQKIRELYLAEMKDAVSLKERIEQLVKLRSRDGYMAEYEELEEGGFLFIENHCPICAAAVQCQGFCRAELLLFEQVLMAKVKRVEHVLFNARRCAYIITPKIKV